MIDPRRLHMPEQRQTQLRPPQFPHLKTPDGNVHKADFSETAISPNVAQPVCEIRTTHPIDDDVKRSSRTAHTRLTQIDST